MVELVKVAIILDYPTAGMLQSLLCVEGLHPLEVQDSPHVGFNGDDFGYYVEVPVPEAAKAVALIREAGYARNIL